MTTITIHETTEKIQGETGMTSYKALNASGKGKPVAKVTGDLIVQKDEFGSDEVKFDGGTWALRDILSIARRGERGLAIA